MSTLRFHPCLALSGLMLSTMFHTGAQTRYRDPAGRFSLPVPSGWTATLAGPVLTLASGDSYALVAIIAGGAVNQRLVAQFTDRFGRQWQGYQRLQNGPATLAGITGAVVLYSGRNPKGVDALVKAISIPHGNDACLLLFSAPVREWETQKFAIEAIERGFALDGGTSAAATPAAPRTPPPQTYPAPSTPVQHTARTHELPAGFQIAARSGPSGQALTASFTGGESARMVFRGIFPHLSSYFDTPPQLSVAVADQQDHQIQAFFRAVYQGAPVRGLMNLTVNGGKGYTCVLFDRPDLFVRSMPALSKGVATSLPKDATAVRTGAAAGAPAQPQPLHNTALLDGSGYVGLPSGWRITGSFKGVVDIAGPEGQIVSFGGYQIAYANPLPGTPASIMVGTYRPPAAALALYLDTLTQHALRAGRATFHIVEQQPAAASNGGQGAYILYDISLQGKNMRGFTFVSTTPIDNTSWMYYMSSVGAPAERFAQDFPTMWAMWKSWSVNPAVFRERMDSALQSMRETFKLIQSAHDYQQRTYDNVNMGWDQVIRGVTTIEDIVTRERADVDTNNVDYILRRLNEHGYQYRQVPLQELVR